MIICTDGRGRRILGEVELCFVERRVVFVVGEKSKQVQNGRKI